MLDLLIPFRVRGLRRKKKIHVFYPNEKPVCGMKFDIWKFTTPYRSDPMCSLCLKFLESKSRYNTIFKFIIMGYDDQSWVKREYH